MTNGSVATLIANALGPVMAEGMRPSMKKSLFGKMRVTPMQIGYIQGTTQACCDHLFLNTDVAERAFLRIMNEYFKTDIFALISKISANQEEYSEGLLLGRQRFDENWVESDIILRLTSDIFDLVNLPGPSIGEGST